MQTAKHTSQLWLAKASSWLREGGHSLVPGQCHITATHTHPWYGYNGLVQRYESVNGTLPNLQGWEVRQKIITNKETHEDPIINGSLQRKEIHTQHRTSLGCYTTLKLHIGDVTLQLTLVSGGSKHYSQVWFLHMFKCFNAIGWWCTWPHTAWTLPGWTAIIIHVH